MPTDFHIDTSEFRRSVEQLIADTKAAVRDETLRAGTEMAALAKALAPHRTGALAASISVNQGPPPAYATLRGPPPTDIGVNVSVGDTAVRYAHLVEGGTGPHRVGGKFEGAMHPGSKPHPFFFPAFRAQKRVFARRLARAINAAARQQAKGG